MPFIDCNVLPSNKSATIPTLAPLKLSRIKREDLRESLARLVRQVNGVHFKLDSGVEFGMKRRGLTAPSLP